MANLTSSTQEINDRVSESDNMPTGIGNALKYSCYLICLLALLFFVSSPDISQFGLFFLWLVAPFWMTYRLKIKIVRGNLLWLILAVAAASGVFSGGRRFQMGLYLALSTIFWMLYLCFGALSWRHMSFREACQIACIALFSEPWIFFVSASPDDVETRRRRLARRIYILYVLLVLLVCVVLLAIRADERIGGLLRTLGELIAHQLPLIFSCLVLALFPAAFLYGFLTELKALSMMQLPDDLAATGTNFAPILPWYAPSLLLTVTNTLFLVVELCYSYILKESNIPKDYGFYDIFAILGMVFLSLVVLFSQLDPSTNRNRAIFICLSISDMGLLIIAGHRLWNYVYFHGFWRERILVCSIFLLWIILSLCILPFSASSQGALHRVGVAAAVVAIALLVLPKELALAQINTSIFIHKYHEEQLEGQRDRDAQTPVLLSESDLDIKAITACGIDGIPALARITGIDDIIYENETLGDYTQKTIIELLCSDLNITTTGELERDLAAIQSATSAMPRYRLPTSWFIAIRSLADIEWNIA